MGGFRKAERVGSRLKLLLSGPSGSGKTFTALRIAQAMALALKKRVAVIDTEHGEASLYAGRQNPDGGEFDFDVIELKQYDPQSYITAMGQIGPEHGVLVGDSLSHAWAGPGGVLAIVDDVAAREKGNKFAAWRVGTPEHQRLVEAIVECPVHQIWTTRAKTEWGVTLNEAGKSVPNRVGTAPVQRDGTEYEFTIYGEIDLDHRMTIAKTRFSSLDKVEILKPGAEFAKLLLDELEGDVRYDADALVAELNAAHGLDRADVDVFLVSIKRPVLAQMTEEQIARLVWWSRGDGKPRLEALAKAKAAAKEAPGPVTPAPSAATTPPQGSDANRPADTTVAHPTDAQAKAIDTAAAKLAQPGLTADGASVGPAADLTPDGPKPRGRRRG